jgi:hypothetical protein
MLRPLGADRQALCQGAAACRNVLQLAGCGARCHGGECQTGYTYPPGVYNGLPTELLIRIDAPVEQGLLSTREMLEGGQCAPVPPDVKVASAATCARAQRPCTVNKAAGTDIGHCANVELHFRKPLLRVVA